jgi:hypothetical protein
VIFLHRPYFTRKLPRFHLLPAANDNENDPAVVVGKGKTTVEITEITDDSDSDSENSADNSEKHENNNVDDAASDDNNDNDDNDDESNKSSESSKNSKSSESVEEPDPKVSKNPVISTTTRSGRGIVPPPRFRDYAAAAMDNEAVGYYFVPVEKEPVPWQDELIEALHDYHNIQSVSNAEMSFSIGLDNLPADNYLPAFEYGFVGAGIGGGFTDTHELHTRVYDEAMATPDASKWKEAVHDEYKRMEKYSLSARPC